jgi:hypothetical protein
LWVGPSPQAQVPMNNFWQLYDGGDPQLIVDARTSKLSSIENGSFDVLANVGRVAWRFERRPLVSPVLVNQ